MKVRRDDGVLQSGSVVIAVQSNCGAFVSPQRYEGVWISANPGGTPFRIGNQRSTSAPRRRCSQAHPARCLARRAAFRKIHWGEEIGSVKLRWSDVSSDRARPSCPRANGLSRGASGKTIITALEDAEEYDKLISNYDPRTILE